MYNAAYEIHVLIIYPNRNFDQTERTHNLSLSSVKKYDIIRTGDCKIVSNFPLTYCFLSK